jgi:hypothetical protein
MLYLSETVAMVFFLLMPALVLAGLFLPERKWKAKKVFRHGVFRIETTTAPVVVRHDPVVIRLSAASSIEGIWERSKYRFHNPPMMEEVFA